MKIYKTEWNFKQTKNTVCVKTRTKVIPKNVSQGHKLQ